MNVFFFFILFFSLSGNRIGARGSKIKGNRGSYWERMDDVVGDGKRFELEPFCSRCWVVLLIEISGSPGIPFFFRVLIESKAVPIGVKYRLGHLWPSINRNIEEENRLIVIRLTFFEYQFIGLRENCQVKFLEQE